MEATFGCPQCGHKVTPGTPTCGNCGNDLRPYFSNNPLAGPATAASPKLLRRLALLTLVVGAFVVYGGQVRERIDELEGQPLPKLIEPAAPGAVTEVVEFPGYGGVRPLIADLRSGGLPCNRVQIDSAGPPVETGSCQNKGTHVQVNVYLTRPSLRMAKEIFREWPFAHVHRGNRWVITTEPVAEQVRDILGGKLTRAAG